MEWKTLKMKYEYDNDWIDERILSAMRYRYNKCKIYKENNFICCEINYVFKSKEVENTFFKKASKMFIDLIEKYEN